MAGRPPDKGRYDHYAIQRVIEKLHWLRKDHPSLSLNAVATAISQWRNIDFHPVNLTRLRAFALSDSHIDVIIEWIVEHHDAKFREKLSPDAIFSQVGETSRDFYFHLPRQDQYDTWETEILQKFAGVYICAPAEDRNSYLPSPTVREFLENHKTASEQQHAKRALDIKQYISERSILVLRATKLGYYHAAELPISLLFPPDFVTLDLRMVYEGIGIASGNSIRVFLRECLSRVSKSHSILIRPKGKIEASNPHQLSINVNGAVRDETRLDWSKMQDADIQHMRREFAGSIELDSFLAGNAQIEVSPIPSIHNSVIMTFARNHVYHRKPADFLNHPEVHFIRPDLRNSDEVRRILENPLTAGMLA